jgi:hypothetical protein
MVWILMPPRRVQHAGEQAPRHRHQRRDIGAAGQAAQLVAQLFIRGCRPVRQSAGDAIGHFRRRRLGEGQAQDPRRLDARQQQA